MKKHNNLHRITQPIAINFQGVSKTYTIKYQKPTLVGKTFGLELRKKFSALTDISFQILSGEKVGIIGPNGSGKTTILKIIAGLTTPTSGSVRVHGKVVSLIELDAGFHPELSGKENIFLNGLIVGMSRQEIERNYQKIVAFSDLKKFIHAPLHTYSSGMALRLGFSIAVHSRPDILILDESVAVGDEAFRQKSLEKIEQFFRAGKTIIMVSHWLEYLQENCSKIIWVENGVIQKIGSTAVIDSYKKHSTKK